MLTNIFTEVLNMSLTASIATLLIIILRIILKNSIPKAFQYFLWSILLLRLLLPISFSSAFSFFNVIPGIQTTSVFQNKENISSIKYIEFASKKPIQQNNSKPINKEASVNLDISYFKSINLSHDKTKDNPSGISGSMEKILLYGAIIWLLGIVCFGLYCFVVYIKTINMTRTATLYSNPELLSNCCSVLSINRTIPMYTSDRIVSPFVMGIFKPRILLPLSLAGEKNESSIKYIILHELVHIKRKTI